MKEKLVKLLGLKARAGEEQIVEAVAALQKSAARIQKSSDRESQILAKMQLTGMQHTDAEHVIDQQAREDATRSHKSPPARKSSMQRETNPHGL